jgi:hypothetical protein
MKRSEMSRDREAMGLFSLHSAYDALVCATYSDLGISAGSLNPMPRGLIKSTTVKAWSASTRVTSVVLSSR